MTFEEIRQVILKGGPVEGDACECELCYRRRALYGPDPGKDELTEKLGKGEISLEEFLMGLSKMADNAVDRLAGRRTEQKEEWAEEIDV